MLLLLVQQVLLRECRAAGCIVPSGWCQDHLVEFQLDHINK